MRLEATALRGGSSADELPDWLNEAVELYEIVSITGWSLDAIDNAPAIVLDELRAVHGVRERLRRRGESSS
jgi:hypothetical protein